MVLARRRSVLLWCSQIARPSAWRMGLPGGQRIALLRVAGLLAVLALFVGACGSGAGSSPASTGSLAPGSTGSLAPGSTGGSTGASEVAPPTTPSTGAAPTAASGGSSRASLPNIADLTTLQSFRWDITLIGAGSFLARAGVPSIPGGDQVDRYVASGVWIAPDQAQVEIDAAGIAFDQTVIGGQQWTSIAGVTTGPVPATSDAASLIYVSAFVDPEQTLAGAEIACGAAEHVNGVQAVRCETNPAANQQIISDLAGPDIQTTDSSFVLWIAEDAGYVARWEFTASGTANGQSFEWNFVANVTDVNNVGSIEP